MFRRPGRNVTVYCILVLLLSTFAACETVGQLNPSGYVNDFAHVLDAESVRQMQYLCSEIEQKTNAQVAVVTVNSLNGVTIESFAHRLFRQWGIGPRSKNRGLLILLSVGDRKYRIEVGTGLEAIVTDRKAAGFGREAVPYLKQMQYGTALRMITRRVADAIAADSHVTIADAPPPTPTPAPARYSSSGTSDSYVGVIVVLVVIVIVILIVYAMNTSPGYAGPAYGSPYVYTSYYGYPSGGYIHTTNNYYGGFGTAVNVSGDAPPDTSWSGGGGFGGGGGFSGFGGGSSSGGGASGDYSDSSSSSSSSDDSGSSGSWSSDSSSSDSSSSDSGGGDSGGGDSGGGASGDY